MGRTPLAGEVFTYCVWGLVCDISGDTFPVKFTNGLVTLDITRAPYGRIHHLARPTGDHPSSIGSVFTIIYIRTSPIEHGLVGVDLL